VEGTVAARWVGFASFAPGLPAGFLRPRAGFLFLDEVLAGFQLVGGFGHGGLESPFFGIQLVALILEGDDFVAPFVGGGFIFVVFPEVKAGGGGKKDGDESPKNARALRTSHSRGEVRIGHAPEVRAYLANSRGRAEVPRMVLLRSKDGCFL